jgi:hypothetical protein
MLKAELVQRKSQLSAVQSDQRQVMSMLQTLVTQQQQPGQVLHGTSASATHASSIRESGALEQELRDAEVTAVCAAPEQMSLVNPQGGERPGDLTFSPALLVGFRRGLV